MEEEKEGAIAVAVDAEHHVHAPQNTPQQPARNTEKTESTNGSVHQEESRRDYSHHQCLGTLWWKWAQKWRRRSATIPTKVCCEIDPDIWCVCTGSDLSSSIGENADINSS